MHDRSTSSVDSHPSQHGQVSVGHAFGAHSGEYFRKATPWRNQFAHIG